MNPKEMLTILSQLQYIFTDDNEKFNSTGKHTE